MKKNLFTILSLLLLAASFQACKKSSSDDSSTTTTTPSPAFQVYVNSVVWTPSSVNAVLTYNATTKTKTLTCTGIDTTDKIVMNLNQPAAALDSTFTSQTYSDTTTLKATYYTLNSSNAFVAAGSTKSAYITITAFDEKKKVMTGTFAFSTTKLNYDASGNVVSITSNTVSSGQFNNFPFTFRRQ